jgi:hypothetical protein
MNKLSVDKRDQILRCLVDGNSIRATARLVGVSINSVVKLLIAAGHACSDYQDKALCNLNCGLTTPPSTRNAAPLVLDLITVCDTTTGPAGMASAGFSFEWKAFMMIQSVAKPTISHG